MRQEKCIKGLVAKHAGKKPCKRPRSRWDDDIMDVQEVGWWGMDWIDLAEDRKRWRTLVNAVVNLRVPWRTLSVGSSFKLVCVY
jgi:hypothetical protein